VPQPKKSTDIKRSHRVKLSFTEDEYNLIAARAQTIGKPVAVYCRQAALNSRIKFVPQPNEEALLELKRQGINLNQAIRAINSSLLSGEIPHSLLNRLTEELNALQEIRLKLLGKANQ
jgi:hypothetical protein